MEVFSKGVHRAMVPIDSHMENVSTGVELVESASGYQMLTQMDVLRFLKDHAGELQSILSCSVQDLGANTERIYAITDKTKLVDAIKCLKAAMLNAVPIVEASDLGEDDHKQHINASLIHSLLTFYLFHRFCLVTFFWSLHFFILIFENQSDLVLFKYSNQIKNDLSYSNFTKINKVM